MTLQNVCFRVCVSVGCSGHNDPFSSIRFVGPTLASPLKEPWHRSCCWYSLRSVWDSQIITVSWETTLFFYLPLWSNLFCRGQSWGHNPFNSFRCIVSAFSTSDFGHAFASEEASSLSDPVKYYPLVTWVIIFLSRWALFLGFIAFIESWSCWKIWRWLEKAIDPASSTDSKIPGLNLSSQQHRIDPLAPWAFLLAFLSTWMSASDMQVYLQWIFWSLTSDHEQSHWSTVLFRPDTFSNIIC